MRRLLPIVAASLLAALPAASAAAAPRSIDDCESIKDANAYNLCLASFGPMRGQRAKTYPGVASEGQKGKGAGTRRGGGHGSGGNQGFGGGVSRSRGGRMRMEFTPGQN